jgi:intracellular sulfur oxidation DsrE/DsrF family protein
MKTILADKRSIFASMVICLICTMSAWSGGVATNGVQAEPDDSDALRDVTVGKVVFDINSTDPKHLAGYLRVIGKTYNDFLRQDVKPEIILAFRGIAVTFISTDRKRFAPEQHESLDQISQQINDLHQKGVKMESCAIAMRGQKVDEQTLLDGIKTVGNTFISLTGYQNKDYAVIPIY